MSVSLVRGRCAVPSVLGWEPLSEPSDEASNAKTWAHEERHPVVMQLDIDPISEPIDGEERERHALEQIPGDPDKLFPAGDWYHEVNKIVWVEGDTQHTLNQVVHPNSMIPHHEETLVL